MILIQNSYYLLGVSFFVYILISISVLEDNLNQLMQFMISIRTRTSVKNFKCCHWGSWALLYNSNRGKLGKGSLKKFNQMWACTVVTYPFVKISAIEIKLATAFCFVRRIHFSRLIIELVSN